ncbi:uncharacterized protein TrAFT101_011925 [Trichoderma asperellum]|uniref:uncharacterized protein n=1 Tax=Trichoderma asperellum TaxID=101201 RepID=UPI0033190551|nr:hypothetical protein TrAFT101_011925 [Trichoderma asperellum]
MESAQYMEGGWEIRLSTGESFRSRYLVTALGALSKAYFPRIPGLDSLAGETYHTTAWPAKHDFFNKHVGVIGNGSTSHVIPNSDDKVTEENRKRINDNYGQIWHNLRTNLSGHAIIESSIPTMSITAEERERVFEQVQQSGNGITFLFSTFGDIAINEEANSEASYFIRRKIAQIVKDPVQARKLTPPGGFNRRPVTANGYYETFNWDNVDVVDVLDTPMEITPTGIKLSDGTKYDLDAIVFATALKPLTAYAGFPNMFLINEPQGPLTNVPALIETQVEFVAGLIATEEAEKKKRLGDRETAQQPIIEVIQEAEDAWLEQTNAIGESTVFAKGGSRLTGDNAEGKKHNFLYYIGGVVNYNKAVQTEIVGGHPSFKPFF